MNPDKDQSELAAVLVGGVAVNPRSLWGHFGSRFTDGFETDFSVVIPVSLASAIVKDRRTGGQSWAQLIQHDLNVLRGTVLEAYLDRIAGMNGAEPAAYEWVVVCVDRVNEVGNVITITGRIRRLLAHLGPPNLVPLE